MRFPIILKALRRAVRGESFSKARQELGDRRLAKSLVRSGKAITIAERRARIIQDHFDREFAHSFVNAPGGGGHQGQYDEMAAIAHERRMLSLLRANHRTAQKARAATDRSHLVPLHSRFAYPGAPKLPPIPKLPVRSGSDPDVGGRVPMSLRADHIEV